MRSPTLRNWALLLATIVGALCTSMSAEEPFGLLAAGTGRLQPKIAARRSAEDARTYGTTSTTVLSFNSSTFTPNDSSTTYTSSPANHGIYITGGHPFLFHGVDLPEGALVTEMDLDGCDNDSAGSITLFFRKCSLGGSCVDLAIAGTELAATPGCAIFQLSPLAVTIDNLNNSYFVSVSTEGSDNAAFFGVQLFYELQVSPAPLTATFADVPTSHPFFRAIEALAAAGITSGCGNGNFCPDKTVTRAEIAKFFALALGLHHAP